MSSILVTYEGTPAALVGVRRFSFLGDVRSSAARDPARPPRHLHGLLRAAGAFRRHGGLQRPRGRAVRALRADRLRAVWPPVRMTPMSRSRPIFGFRSNRSPKRGRNSMAPADDSRSTIEWSLIATLHHRPGRPTAVELAPGTQRIDVDAWSRSEGWCEHCRTRRTRRTTYLLRRRNGSLAQIGSTCLAEFLGDPDPMRVLRPGSRHRSPRQRHHHGDAHRRPSEYVDAHLYLAHVAQAVFDGGFVSSVGATSGTPATWSRALATLDVARSPSSRARRRARQTVEWVRDEVRSRPAARRLRAPVGPGARSGPLDPSGATNRRSRHLRLPPASAETNRGARAGRRIPRRARRSHHGFARGPTR